MKMIEKERQSEGWKGKNGTQLDKNENDPRWVYAHFVNQIDIRYVSSISLFAFRAILFQLCVYPVQNSPRSSASTIHINININVYNIPTKHMYRWALCAKNSAYMHANAKHSIQCKILIKQACASLTHHITSIERCNAMYTLHTLHTRRSREQMIFQTAYMKQDFDQRMDAVRWQ